MTALALCPGSYDPITLGHLDIARRAQGIIGQVVIGIANNANKKYLFSLERRVELARLSVSELGLEGVSVEPIDGLLANYIKERGVTAIVKGLRSSGDFESERAMALLNRHMSGVETLFIMGDQGLNHVASSYVKEIASYGVELAGSVTEVVRSALKDAYGEAK